MYVYKAKLDRVVDGDTVDANIDLGFDISINKRIRLAGIDTPETRTRNKEEKIKGLASKSRLIELLKDGTFILESKEVGKYGRVLGTLHVNDININKTLVKEGFAVEYWGGKKNKKK
jgi:micrococcal nuclease